MLGRCLVLEAGIVAVETVGDCGAGLGNATVEDRRIYMSTGLTLPDNRAYRSETELGLALRVPHQTPHLDHDPPQSLAWIHDTWSYLSRRAT